VLPGVAEAVATGNADGVVEQVNRLIAALGRTARTLNGL
jgi:hypothetical protein